jgi:NitT/TauT family transport system permease protein
MLSIVAGVALAAPLAILSAQIRLLDQFVTPLMYFIYPAPKIVFLPLIIVFLGLGDQSKIFLIGLIIFFQVFVIVRDAAAQVRDETLESINSLGANAWQRLRYVYLPVSLPAIMTALKISAGTAIAVLFIAETIGTTTGLGYYIMNQWGRFNYTSMYAGILAMSLLGLALFVSFDLLEKRLTRWKAARSTSSSR